MYIKGSLFKKGRRLERLVELLRDDSGQRLKWGEVSVQCRGESVSETHRRLVGSGKYGQESRRLRYTNIERQVSPTRLQ